jgi:hypothetical protein
MNDLWVYDGGNWTWMYGSSLPEQLSSYGVKGATFPSNVPESRQVAIGWRDNNGIFWMFGGHGYDENSSLGK